MKDAFAVYVCIQLSVSYFILRSSNFWRKCPCYLKFGIHTLMEMFLKTVSTFFMKFFLSKDSFILIKLSTNQNWPKSVKLIIAKTICIIKQRAHVFSKIIIRNMYSKLSSKSRSRFLESQRRTYFLKIFPGQILRNVIQYEWMIFIWNESLIILYPSYIFMFF